MNKKELTGAVTRLLQEPLEQNGFVLWDIDYIKNREGAQLVIDVDVVNLGEAFADGFASTAQFPSYVYDKLLVHSI